MAKIRLKTHENKYFLIKNEKSLKNVWWFVKIIVPLQYKIRK